MDLNNLILVEQHFCKKGHDLNKDEKFTIIERIEKDINMKSIIKKKWRMDKKSENICINWILYET